MLHQPMHSAIRPNVHRMEHEVGNVGLRSLVHHVVMLVNMENVRWRYSLCTPSLFPSAKGVIVTFHNHGHGTASPVKQLLQTQSWVGHLVKVIEVDIKNRINHVLFAAERFGSGARFCVAWSRLLELIFTILSADFCIPCYSHNGLPSRIRAIRNG